MARKFGKKYALRTVTTNVTFYFFSTKSIRCASTDSLIGALAKPSSWDAVAGMVYTARQKDAFVRSINKVQVYVHIPFCEQLCAFCHCPVFCYSDVRILTHILQP